MEELFFCVNVNENLNFQTNAELDSYTSLKVCTDRIKL